MNPDGTRVVRIARRRSSGANRSLLRRRVLRRTSQGPFEEDLLTLPLDRQRPTRRRSILSSIVILISAAAFTSGDGQNLAFVSIQSADFPVPVLHGHSMTSSVGALGRIAFDDDTRDVWRVNDDGTGLQRLTADQAQEFDPTWSPDAMMIAYRSETEGDSEIYVMNADGSNRRNVTNNPAADYSPSWSPDGSRIAFASDRAGPFNDIYVMNSDGSGVRRVTRHVSVDEYPTWSPDSRRIAFHSDRVGHWEIYIINVDGTHERRLTRRGGKLPSWSPRGSLIAYTGPSGPRLEEHRMNALWLVRVDGRRARRIARTVYTPEWSPDGTGILVSRPGTGLTILALDGKVRRRIGLTPAINADWVKINP